MGSESEPTKREIVVAVLAYSLCSSLSAPQDYQDNKSTVFQSVQHVVLRLTHECHAMHNCGNIIIVIINFIVQLY